MSGSGTVERQRPHDATRQRRADGYLRWLVGRSLHSIPFSCVRRPSVPEPCVVYQRRSIKRAERENSLGQLFLYTGSRFEVDMSGQGKAHIPSSSSRTGCRCGAVQCARLVAVPAAERAPTDTEAAAAVARAHRRGRPPVSRWNVPTSPRRYLMHRARCQ